MTTETLSFTAEEFDYLRHGDTPLRMRLFRPAGAGPHPVVIDLHGGAWNKNDLTNCFPRDEVLASMGLAVAAIDFRHAADGYPTSLADINYAVRWLKARAGALGLDAARIGLCGQSSGGHLAMLSAMRPFDPRYGAIALAPEVVADTAGSAAGGAGDESEVDAAMDASIRCVGMLWPVINPLSRYRHALRQRAAGAAWVTDMPESHDRYWRDEATMAEGNPVLALERGEAVATPPTLWVQGRPDIVHDYHDPDSGQDLNEPERFAHAYRAAGGEIEVLYVDKAAASSAAASFEPLGRFFLAHLAG
jgi:acetyl esterase